MSVDSIHSTIEQSVRNNTVWAPSQWATICELARKEPTPCIVENLTHEDFLDFDVKLVKSAQQHLRNLTQTR
ncbi:unnamed protein product [Euphydryas editha]|uniref:Uncharacterized protein n=1 Tax=Euphydryas editha TaxID=104508 RepID=A0AAU9TZ67_EUPED|nr:unnamed protein product [Euphydryas editha]